MLSLNGMASFVEVHYHDLYLLVVMGRVFIISRSNVLLTSDLDLCKWPLPAASVGHGRDPTGGPEVNCLRESCSLL